MESQQPFSQSNSPSWFLMHSLSHSEVCLWRVVTMLDPRLLHSMPWLITGRQWYWDDHGSFWNGFSSLLIAPSWKEFSWKLFCFPSSSRPHFPNINDNRNGAHTLASTMITFLFVLGISWVELIQQLTNLRVTTRESFLQGSIIYCLVFFLLINASKSYWLGLTPTKSSKSNALICLDSHLVSKLPALDSKPVSTKPTLLPSSSRYWS